MQNKTDQADDGTELPADFADHVADLTDLKAPPATLEEWWSAIAEQYESENITIGRNHLYSDTPTRHEVHVNGRVRYTYCVMDALMGAVMEDQTTVTIRSVDPVRAIPVTITVSPDAVEVSPADAVISFGSNLSVEEVEAVGSLASWSVQDNTAEIQAAVCQYTNAFESEASYVEWASVTESISAPFPPASVVSLLRSLPLAEK